MPYEELRKLKIIAETLDGYYHPSTSLEAVKHLIEYAPKGVSSWWYLHGKLQDLVGYDKAIIVEFSPMLLHKTYIDKDINKEYTKKYLPDGIYEVEILDIDKPCVGYFWTEFEEFDNIVGEVPTMRGLVVFKDDVKAVNYAKEMYIKKSTFL